jgi:hypothetical protein
MVLLAAVPPSWDTVSALYLNNVKTVTAINFADVRQAIMAEFDRVQHPKGQAQKLSAVKRKGESPSFKSQQDKGKANAKPEQTAETADDGNVNKSKKKKGGARHNKGKKAAPAVAEAASDADSDSGEDHTSHFAQSVRFTRGSLPAPVTK